MTFIGQAMAETLSAITLVDIDGGTPGLVLGTCAIDPHYVLSGAAWLADSNLEPDPQGDPCAPHTYKNSFPNHQRVMGDACLCIELDVCLKRW